MFEDEPKRVGEALRRAGYDTRRLTELVGAPLDAIDPMHFLLRRGDGSPLDTLARVFAGDGAVPLDRFVQAVAPSGLEDWRALGLIEVVDDRVSARLQLSTSGSLVIAHDRLRRVLCNDYVMGSGQSTRTLDRMTVRRRPGTTLDLGTGSGVLALHAALHGDRVVGVDVNPRAIELARLNAALNDLELELFEGELFAPIAGRRFDLVVANPPFILSPERGRVYRDGGRRGDELVQSIVRSVPSHLEEGGFAQIVCDWSSQRAKSWKRRLRGWFEGSSCDVWVMKMSTLDAAQYAAFQVRGIAAPDESAEALGRRYEAWLAYYEEEGIEEIHHGVITMRRRSTHEPWLRIDDAPAFEGDCGDDVLAAFAARDTLETMAGDQPLLDARLRGSRALVCERLSAPGHGENCRLRRARGLLYTTPVDHTMIELVSRLEGERTLLEAITEVARETDERLDVVVRKVMPKVRELIEKGFFELPTAR